MFLLINTKQWETITPTKMKQTSKIQTINKNKKEENNKHLQTKPINMKIKFKKYHTCKRNSQNAKSKTNQTKKQNKTKLDTPAPQFQLDPRLHRLINVNIQGTVIKNSIR